MASFYFLSRYDLLKEMIVKASHLQGLVTDMIRKVSQSTLSVNI